MPPCAVRGHVPHVPYTPPGTPPPPARQPPAPRDPQHCLPITALPFAQAPQRARAPYCALSSHWLPALAQQPLSQAFLAGPRPQTGTPTSIWAATSSCCTAWGGTLSSHARHAPDAVSCVAMRAMRAHARAPSSICLLQRTWRGPPRSPPRRQVPARKQQQRSWATTATAAPRSRVDGHNATAQASTSMQGPPSFLSPHLRRAVGGSWCTDQAPPPPIPPALRSHPSPRPPPPPPASPKLQTYTPAANPSANHPRLDPLHPLPAPRPCRATGQATKQASRRSARHLDCRRLPELGPCRSAPSILAVAAMHSMPSGDATAAAAAPRFSPDSQRANGAPMSAHWRPPPHMHPRRGGRSARVRSSGHCAHPVTPGRAPGPT